MNLKIKRPLLKFILIPSLLNGLIGINYSHAESGLPYLGTRKSECTSPVIPKHLGSGAKTETDENCKTLFIHPPEIGIAQITSYSPTSNLDNCKLINNMNATHVNASSRLTELLIKNKNNVDLISGENDLGTDELAKLTAEIDRVVGVINVIKRLYESTRDFIREQNAEVGGGVTVTLYTKWDDVIRAYQIVNPNYNVVRLPINYSVLSYNMQKVTTTDDLTRIDEITSNPVISTTNSTLPSKVPTKDPKQGDIPDADNSAGRGQFVFGSSANVGMMLSLLGMCPYTKTESDVDLPGQKALTAYLVPNVTYYYPVVSKSYYTVKIDTANLSKTVKTLVEKSQDNSLDFVTLSDELAKKGTGLNFVEEHQTDLENNTALTEAQKTKLRADLIDYVTTTVLKNIGTFKNALAALPENTKNVSESHTARRCSSSWIFFKKCHNYEYTITVKKPDWDKIAKKIEDILNTPYQSSASDQRTYERNGTFAFVPPEEYLKLINAENNKE